MTTLPLTATSYRSVFFPQEPFPEDASGDLAMVLEWIRQTVACDSQPPSNRVKAAFKHSALYESLVVDHYLDAMRHDFGTRILPDEYKLRVYAVASIKKGYEFGARYLRFSPPGQTLFHQGLCALLRPAFPEPLLDALFNELFFLPELPALSRILESLGLADSVRYTVTHLAGVHIQARVLSTCVGAWREPCLLRLDRWTETSLHPLICTIYPAPSSGAGVAGPKPEDPILGSLQKAARDQLLSLRTTETFDLVAAFPASAPALEEMRQCVREPAQRVELVNHFVHLMHRRLLHAAVTTATIVSFYVSLIRAFLLIDPKGVLLDKVARPLRRYLKDRDDTVLHLVRGVLGDPSASGLSVLAEELQQPVAPPEEDQCAVTWCPDPIDALPDFKKGKVGDVLGLLISLFASTDAFVAECVEVFAAELFTLADFDVTPAVEKLEALKRRFPENELGALDIMVRDLVESKRINQKMNAPGTGIPSLRHDWYAATVISHLYWPTVARDSFTPPRGVGQTQRQYQERFEALKTGRSMHIAPALGRVVLELEMGGRATEYTVTPVQATVVCLFEDRSRLTLAEVMASMVVGSDQRGMVTKALQFWIGKGVVTEVEPELYTVVELEEPQAGERLGSVAGASPTEFDVTPDCSTMARYWPFISGMLTNLGSSDTKKIHGFLKMLVPKAVGGYTATELQLETYLSVLVAEERVEYVDGRYRSVKRGVLGGLNRER